MHTYTHIHTHTTCTLHAHSTPYPDWLVESFDAGVQGMYPALTFLKVLGYRGSKGADTYCNQEHTAAMCTMQDKCQERGYPPWKW